MVVTPRQRERDNARPLRAYAATLPVPEALTDGRGSGWTVGPHPSGGGATSIDDRVIAVTLESACPRCGAEHGRAVRAHELCHAQYTPDSTDLRGMGIDPASVDAFDHLAEEIRIAAVMRVVQVGQVRASCRVNDTQLPAPDLPTTDPRAIADGVMRTLTGACATFGTPDWRPWSVAFTRRYAPGCGHPIRDAFDACRDLIGHAFDALPRWRESYAPTDPTGGWPWTARLANDLRDLYRRYAQPAPDPTDEPDEPGTPTPIGRKPRILPQPGTFRWGTMTIERPPLPDRGAPPPRRAKRYGLAGLTPRAPWRELTDGRIFSERRERAGGTVLIDVSGSMSWPPDLLRQLVAEVPAATIALYSGSRVTGHLVIVGRDGYITTDPMVLRSRGGNNVIDGPALDWLALQPQPRLWISDGLATAPIIGCTTATVADARDRAIAAEACRVETVDSALAVLRSGRKRFGADDVPPVYR